MPPGADRAMEVWDKPNEFSPGVIQAFKLYFPLSALFLTPDQRTGKKWKGVIYIGGGNHDACAVLAVYVTKFEAPFSFSNNRSFCLGIWALPDGTFAQLVAQGEPENYEKSSDDLVIQGKANAKQAGIELPDNAVFQFWGTDALTGARFTIILPHRRPLG